MLYTQKSYLLQIQIMDAAQELKEAYQQGEITRQDYKIRLLNLFGLPASMATTQEEEETEVYRELRED